MSAARAAASQDLCGADDHLPPRPGNRDRHAGARNLSLFDKPWRNHSHVRFRHGRTSSFSIWSAVGKSARNRIADSFARLPAMRGRRFARCFCRYSGNIASDISYIKKRQAHYQEIFHSVSVSSKLELSEYNDSLKGLQINSCIKSFGLAATQNFAAATPPYDGKVRFCPLVLRAFLLPQPVHPPEQ